MAIGIQRYRYGCVAQHLGDDFRVHVLELDLIVPDLDGKRVVIQLKRWNGPVGNAAVSATFAGIAHYQADEGWIITTSTFTRSAHELARSTSVRFIDGKELADWLEGLREEGEEGRPTNKKPRTVDLGAESTQKEEDIVTESSMEKHTVFCGLGTMGETVRFTAKRLGTAKVNGGKDAGTEEGMDLTYYRLPDNTYRVLIEQGDTKMLLPSNMAEAWRRGEPVEYGRWTLQELEAEDEYGRVFGELMKRHPEGRKQQIRDLD